MHRACRRAPCLKSFRGAQTRGGGTVRVRLRALPDRPLLVELFRSGERCAARALSTIHGQRAMVRSIYLDIGSLFSLNFLRMRGLRTRDGSSVQETLRP